MVPSRIHFLCTTTGTAGFRFLMDQTHTTPVRRSSDARSLTHFARRKRSTPFFLARVTAAVWRTVVHFSAHLLKSILVASVLRIFAGAGITRRVKWPHLQKSQEARQSPRRVPVDSALSTAASAAPTVLRGPGLLWPLVPAVEPRGRRQAEPASFFVGNMGRKTHSPDESPLGLTHKRDAQGASGTPETHRAALSPSQPTSNGARHLSAPVPPSATLPHTKNWSPPSSDRSGAPPSQQASLGG